MSTNQTTKVPESMDAAADVAGVTYITGKIAFVSAQQGLNVIGVTGGQNPGQYVISANVTGGLSAALTGLTNKANIWGTLDANKQINTISVYSN